MKCLLSGRWSHKVVAWGLLIKSSSGQGKKCSDTWWKIRLHFVELHDFQDFLMATKNAKHASSLFPRATKLFLFKKIWHSFRIWEEKLFLFSVSVGGQSLNFCSKFYLLFLCSVTSFYKHKSILIITDDLARLMK